jgi:hypothetical protein
LFLLACSLTSFSSPSPSLQLTLELFFTLVPEFCCFA